MDAAARPVQEHTGEIADIPVFWRSAPTDGTPILWLHGVPTSSDLWLPFLERIGGVAPDLPGFGRSAKRGDWDYSIRGYRAYLDAFLDHLAIDRYRLVVHDWGAVGLALAQAAPERVERLVIFNSVPLLPGYRWHWVARIWRRRGLGELAMGATTRWGFHRALRDVRGTGAPFPPDLAQAAWEHFDQGTQRAILRLYRSADPEVLADAGRELSRITAPALVVWGERDAYVYPKFANAYASAFRNAEVRLVPDAGHWPWLDRPELVEAVGRFLSSGR